MIASGRSNHPRFTRATMVKTKTSKGKSTKTKDPSHELIKTLTKTLKNLELSHAQQMREVHNRLIVMENSQQNSFPPKVNDSCKNDKW